MVAGVPVPDVHLLHAGLVDLGALGDASLGLVVLVLLVELLMEYVLAFVEDAGALLLILLEADDQFLEGLLVGLLNHKILDGRVRLFAALHRQDLIVNN